MIPEAPTWHARAACRGLGPARFFYDKGQKINWPAVRECCDVCPVHQECFIYALESEIDGVWAGTTEEGRRQFRRTVKIRVKVPGEAQSLARCGSDGGYQAHRRRGETPCAACRRARVYAATRRKERGGREARPADFGS